MALLKSLVSIACGLRVQLLVMGGVLLIVKKV